MPKQEKRTSVLEQRRRAGVLVRYAAIPRPTHDDDARFAAELGLSTDSLVRLAKIWRRHGRMDLLTGSAAAIQAGAAPDVLVHASEINLEGVPRTMRGETLRRIRVIQAHLRAVAQGCDDAAASAAELGLSIKRFEVLVRAWRALADPSALPGSGQRQSGGRRRDPTRERMLSILHDIVASEGPRVRVSRIDRLYRDACAAAGIQPLSTSRVYSLVKEIRRSTTQTMSSSE